MKKTILKKPTIFQLTIGLFVSIFQSIFTKREILVPQTIGKYNLISEVKKEIKDKEYAIGIYEYKRKKVFIKTWKGTIKNFRYYFLINDYIVNRIMYEKLRLYQASNSLSRIKMPKIINYIKSKNSFSVVYEYIEGKTLTSFPIKKQTKVLSEVLITLNKVSELFTEDEKRQLPKRTLLFYLVSLPFFTFLTLASNIGGYKIILRSLVNCLTVFKSLKKTRLYIAHRDLKLHNILLSNSDSYIIDWERMVLTIPDYDITQLSLHPGIKSSIDLVSKNFPYISNTFLKNYILIHQFNDLKSRKN